MASQSSIRIIIDDMKARKVAEHMGLKVTGTIGILMKAERIGLIARAEDKVGELRSKGFYVSDDLLKTMAQFKHKR